MGRVLAAQGITLVYGGSSIGLMGLMADAALAEGGRVVGVMPRGLFRREVAHTGLSELIEVDSMHERKLTMFELSSAYVALPGGIGTLEELTEVLSWAQLGLHDRPIVTVNVDGFWDPFHHLLRHAVEAELVRPASLDLLLDVATPEEALAVLYRGFPGRPPPER